MYQNSEEERREEIGASLFAVLAGLLLITFFAVRCTPLWGHVSGAVGSAVHSGVAAVPILTEGGISDADLEAANERVAAAEAKISSLEEQHEDTLAAQAQRDAEAARLAKREAKAAKLAQVGDDGSLGLSNALGERDAARGQLTDLTANLDAAAAAKQQALADAEAAIAERDHSRGDVTRLMGENEDLQAQLDAANAEKARLEQEAKDAQQAAMQALKDAENAKAEAVAAAAIPAVPVPVPAAEAPADPPAAMRFVESADDLTPKAAELFRDLQKVHTADGSMSTDEVNGAYATASEKSKASLMMRIPFGSGQSDISSDVAKLIGNKAKRTSDDSFFLVVGYADKTGSDSINRGISEGRASNVAKAITSTLGSAERLQAAYMGSTVRFDPSDLSKNRVVEVWNINP